MKTLTKKSTHIAKIRQMNATQIERVCELLGWTRMQYCRYQYSQYEKFISRLCEEAPHLATHLRYSAIFRGLFNNEWLDRNEKMFIPYATHSTETISLVDIHGELIIDEGLEYGDDLLKEEYHEIHNAKGLFYNQDLAAKVGHVLDQILPYV